jgi:hypothetical protein
MAFNFSAAYPSGPTANSPAGKTLQVKAVKLTYADFSTGGTTSSKTLVLPKEASVVGLRTWTKTAFTGNGITAIALAVNSTAGNIFSGAFTNTTNSYAVSGGVANIVQDAGTVTADQKLTFVGTSTTGNPTAGELIVIVEYVI